MSAAQVFPFPDGATRASTRRKLPREAILRDSDLHELFGGHAGEKPVAVLSFLKVKANGAAAIVLRDKVVAAELGWSHATLKRVKRRCREVGIPVFGVRDGRGVEFTATKWVLDRRMVPTLAPLSPRRRGAPRSSGEASEGVGSKLSTGVGSRPGVGSLVTLGGVTGDPTYKDKKDLSTEVERSLSSKAGLRPLEGRASPATAEGGLAAAGGDRRWPVVDDLHGVGLRILAELRAWLGEAGSDDAGWVAELAYAGRSQRRYGEAHCDDTTLRLAITVLIGERAEGDLDRQQALLAAVAASLDPEVGEPRNGYRQPGAEPSGGGLPESQPPADERAA